MTERISAANRIHFANFSPPGRRRPPVWELPARRGLRRDDPHAHLARQAHRVGNAGLEPNRGPDSAPDTPRMCHDAARISSSSWRARRTRPSRCSYNRSSTSTPTNSPAEEAAHTSHHRPVLAA